LSRHLCNYREMLFYAKVEIVLSTVGNLPYSRSHNIRSSWIDIGTNFNIDCDFLKNKNISIEIWTVWSWSNDRKCCSCVIAAESSNPWLWKHTHGMKQNSGTNTVLILICMKLWWLTNKNDRSDIGSAST
jgi:hypothetical protein